MDRNDSLRNVIRKAKKVLSGVDWWQVRFIPDGADDPLPLMPREVTFSDREIEAAIDDFDKNHPEYSGLLDGEVFKRREFDGED